MNAQVGNIGIAESRKIPLKVAIVVPDPPTHRIMYTPPKKTEAIDQTGTTGEQLWPINNELGKASKEVFSQVFEQATLLRQMPALGSDYDLIISVNLKEVDMDGSGVMDSTMSLKYIWSISIRNNEGVEIFKREDKTPDKKYKMSTTMETYTENWGKASSELMAEMVKSWGLMINDSRQINEYLKNSGK